MLCRALCALLFIAWTAEGAKDTVLYCGLWRSPFELLGPFLATLPGIGLSTWQLLLFALALVSLVSGGVGGRAWPMAAAIVTSAASVAVTFLWGVVRGGTVYEAYFQLWRFLAALLVATALIGAIRRPRDLKAIGLTVFAAGLVRATLAIWFYQFHVKGKVDLAQTPYMTTHDDSVLFVAAIVVATCWALERRRYTTWAVALVANAVVVYAIVLNNRRLAWIELLVAFGFGYLVLPRGWRRRANRWLLVAAPVVLLYVAVGWNREGAVFAPVRALSTAGSNEDNSSLARLEENRNLLYTLTVTGNPLLGTGWGQPYVKFTSVFANFDAGWTLYLYTPHNSLLGVAVFGGLVGIFGIWLVVPVAAFLATLGVRGSTRSVDRAAAMAALCILPAHAAQCYGDIGFQAQTGNLILGACMAVAAKVSAWAAASRQP